jgi:hypothetical protein
MSSALSPDRARIDLLTRTHRQAKQLASRNATLYGRMVRLAKVHFSSYYLMYAPKWRLTLREMRWRDRPPPDFALTGPVRSGTSALTEYVFQHPCVVLPLAKEPPIFSWSLKHLLAPFPLSREREEVRARYGVAMTGYCTPVVPDLWWPHLAKAINPSLKTVVILRDPVERAFSQWRWDRLLLSRWKDGALWTHFPDFDRAVRLEIDSLRAGGGGFRTVSGTRAGYLVQSIYLPFLRVLFDVMGRDSVLVVNASRFFKEPMVVAREVYDFLGLPSFDPLQTDERNAGPPSALSDATRELLQDFFEPLNEQLYEFLQQDFGWSGRENRAVTIQVPDTRKAIPVPR